MRPNGIMFEKEAEKMKPSKRYVVEKERQQTKLAVMM